MNFIIHQGYDEYGLNFAEFRIGVRRLKLNIGKTALVLGFFVALMHAVWMLLIFLGVAQLYLNWIFGLHLITNPYKVLPFNFGTALTLVIFTFIVGYAGGWVFAFIWNRLHKGR